MAMPGEAIDFNEYRRAWRKANPEKVRAQQKRQRRKNPARIKAKNAASYLRNRDKRLKKVKSYADAHRERYRDQRLQRQYGISLAEYLAMYANQNGRCSCCNAPRPSSGKTGMVVDHNHTTGEVRGLLCLQCNIAIGHLGESALRAESARL
jgi:hypothetical protein